MDKNYVDEIITEYTEKIFGFALSKTMNTDKAEELASRIVFDVYTSLLKADNVHNIDGYIYRVSSNVYARFVDEEVRSRHISLDEVSVPVESDFTDDFEKREDYIRLRREISYLGKTQREIVVMYYFQQLKQYEIAERLNVPLSTVKWHLHDAKNQMKIKLTPAGQAGREGNKMREKGMLGVKPVRFTRMGHNGAPSPDGKDTSYYLSKLISQNIAYAAYHEAKNITEIAEYLGVPAAYIEDEVAHLYDNGFMDKLPGGKYLTNMYITEPVKEAEEAKHKLYVKYARIICEKYAPLVFKAMADYESMKIYVPEDDFNFLMWSVIAYACGRKLHDFSKDIDISKYYVKRRDGGDYIASAVMEGDFMLSELSYNSGLYQILGDMNRSSGDVGYAWQINTYYDDRVGGWQENLDSDYEWLYEYMSGKITKEAEYNDKFKRLFDKGYLINKDGSEYVNMIVCAIPHEEFAAALPALPEEFKALSEELDEEIFKIEKTLFPAHVQDLVRARSINSLPCNAVRARVLEQLAVAGTLKPLTDTQKYSVNTILFCDTLPE
jgi:RNA polymerase sigma factor (sigma-70 family)